MRKHIGVKHHDDTDDGPSATECHTKKRKMMPSFPTWLVAAVAMVMDWASTILPITPPALLAAHISTGSTPSCCEVMRCKLPNKHIG